MISLFLYRFPFTLLFPVPVPVPVPIPIPIPDSGFRFFQTPKMWSFRWDLLCYALSLLLFYTY